MRLFFYDFFNAIHLKNNCAKWRVYTCQSDWNHATMVFKK